MLAKWCRLCYSAIIKNIVNRNQQKSEQDIESQTSGFRGSMLYLSATEQCDYYKFGTIGYAKRCSFKYLYVELIDTAYT